MMAQMLRLTSTTTTFLVLKSTSIITYIPKLTDMSIYLPAAGVPAPVQLDSGYGMPTTAEYIKLSGGPHTSSYTKLADAFNNPTDSRFQSSNLYEQNLYLTGGLPSNYATGSRISNLESNFNNGVTVEFWLKKDGFDTAKTEKEVVFDMWNNNASSSVHYGRLRVELTGAAAGSPFLVTVMSGTSGVYQESIGQSLTKTSLTSYGILLTFFLQRWHKLH